MLCIYYSVIAFGSPNLLCGCVPNAYSRVTFWAPCMGPQEKLGEYFSSFSSVCLFKYLLRSACFSGNYLIVKNIYGLTPWLRIFFFAASLSYAFFLVRQCILPLYMQVYIDGLRTRRHQLTRNE